MAVVKSHILSAGISGSVQGRDRHDTSASYRVRWFVQCDSPEDTAKTVLSHFRRSRDLPFLGDTYEAGNDRDSGAVCTSITPNLVERSGGIFYVDVEYSPAGGDNDEEKPSKSDPGKQTNDPREWNDEIDVSFTQISIPVEFAIFHGFKRGGLGRGGDPKDTHMKPGVMCTPKASNLVPFDPGLEMELDIKIVRFTKYAEQFDADGTDAWIGAVNSDLVTIDKPNCRFRDTWQPLTARIKGLPSTFGVANGIPYWRNSIEVHVNPLGWRRQILDRGMHVRQLPGDRKFGSNEIISPSETGEPWAMIKDENGYPAASPVNLNGHGFPIDPEKEDEVWGIWQTYDERPFAEIKW